MWTWMMQVTLWIYNMDTDSKLCCQGCNRRLDPLLSYSAWVRKTKPTGISNDAMGSAPQHPFFLQVIESLQSYNRNWRVPYITVMYSTGPLFLSVIWKEYIRWGTSEEGRVRILMPDEYDFILSQFDPILTVPLMQVHQKAVEFFHLPQGIIMAQRRCSDNFLGKNERLLQGLGYMLTSYLDGSTLDPPHRFWCYPCRFTIHRRLYRGAKITCFVPPTVLRKSFQKRRVYHPEEKGRRREGCRGLTL